MNRIEIINKIEKQRGFCDIIDAFRVVGVYTDLYGVEYYDMSVEDELIYMYDKIKNYKHIEYLPTDDKTCIKCLITKKRMDFSNDNHSNDNKNSLCKSCYKNRTLYYKNRTPEELLEIENRVKIVRELLEQGLKICSNCGETKKLGEYYKNPNTKSGVGSRCKKCIIKKRNERK